MSDSRGGSAPRAADVVIGGLLSEGRILLVRTRGLPDYWQPPGGKVQDGDSSTFAALRRELLEELGLQLKDGELPIFMTAPSDVSAGVIFFVVIRLNNQPDLEVQRSEILECRWVRVAEALELPMKAATRQFMRSLIKAEDDLPRT